MIAIDKAGDDASGQLAARYGRTPQKKRRDRFVYIAGGIIAAIVVVAWVVWAGLDQAGSSIESQDTGHQIVNDRTVEISYQVSTSAGSAVSCALQVQNEAHGIVGWRVVKLPPSTTYTTSYTNTVRSSELGVTGLIYQCWLS
jgi:hypothetical protein